jgi:hypothetical protein
VLSPDFPIASALRQVVGLLLISTNGFLTQAVPVYLAWMQDCSFLTFGENFVTMARHGMRLDTIVQFCTWGMAMAVCRGRGCAWGACDEGALVGGAGRARA